MLIQAQRFTCSACGRCFDGEVVTHCPLDVAVASMRAVRCPACGADSEHIVIGGERRDVEVPKSVKDRADWWRANGDIGISSATIWSVMTGRPTPCHEFDVPHDPSDFRRCERLLQLIPDWRKDLDRVSAEHPEWQPLVERWPEMRALYAEESPSGSCPKLYALIQELLKESDKLRK